MCSLVREGGVVTLILFDIDGTLVRGAPPIHRQALCVAAQAVFGVTLSPAEFGPTAGMTDSAIARRELRAVGVSDPDITQRLPEYCEAAAEAYEQLAASADLSPYHTPHAIEALEWLLDRGAALGLVTGNIERIAWRKLSAAGLAPYFLQRRPLPSARWEVAPWIGGFGDQGEDRDTLPPLAMARAAQLLGQHPRADETWVIGDTPADIACGLAHDLNVIGVATGIQHSRSDLSAHSPHAALNDLSELPTLASALFPA